MCRFCLLLLATLFLGCCRGEYRVTIQYHGDDCTGFPISLFANSLSGTCVPEPCLTSDSGFSLAVTCSSEVSTAGYEYITRVYAAPGCDSGEESIFAYTTLCYAYGSGSELRTCRDGRYTVQQFADENCQEAKSDLVTGTPGCFSDTINGRSNTVECGLPSGSEDGPDERAVVIGLGVFSAVISVVALVLALCLWRVRRKAAVSRHDLHLVNDEY